jgi:hypothetical protein
MVIVASIYILSISLMVIVAGIYLRFGIEAGIRVSTFLPTPTPQPWLKFSVSAYISHLKHSKTERLK